VSETFPRCTGKNVSIRLNCCEVISMSHRISLNSISVNRPFGTTRILVREVGIRQAFSGPP
jgi:hypothetical protein